MPSLTLILIFKDANFKLTEYNYLGHTMKG